MVRVRIKSKVNVKPEPFRPHAKAPEFLDGAPDHRALPRAGRPSCRSRDVKILSMIHAVTATSRPMHHNTNIVKLKVLATRNLSDELRDQFVVILRGAGEEDGGEGF